MFTIKNGPNSFKTIPSDTDFFNKGNVLYDKTYVVQLSDLTANILNVGTQYTVGSKELEVYVNGMLMSPITYSDTAIVGDYIELSNTTIQFQRGIISEGTIIRFRITTSSYDYSNKNSLDLQQLSKDLYGNANSSLLNHSGSEILNNGIYVITYGNSAISIYGHRHDGTIKNCIDSLDNSNNYTLILDRGVWFIGNDTTVGENIELKFINGATLYVDTGNTLTLNCHINSGLYQIFSGDGDIEVSNNICVYPEWWGAKSNGISDCTEAIQSAINSVIKNYVSVQLSSGSYLVTSTINIELDQSGSLYTYQPFVMRGTGVNTTQIISSVDGPAIWIKGGQWQMSDMTMRCSKVSTTSEAIRLGDDANHLAASEGSMSDIKILYFFIGLVIELAWDCNFKRLGIQSGAVGGHCVDVQLSSWDNSNVLHFDGCHFERIKSGILFNGIGGDANLRSGAFTFSGCHFETNYFNTSALYFYKISNVTFLGCGFRSNSRFGDPESGRVPMIILESSPIIRFYGGYITTSCVTSTANKLIKTLGDTANVWFEKMFIEDYANNPSGLTMDGILDSASSLDPDASGIYFTDMIVEDYRNVALNSKKYVGNTYRRFGMSSDYTSEQLRVFYDQYTQEHTGTSSTDPVLVSGKYGSLSSGLPKTVTNGGYNTWYIETNTFTNGTALILVLADTPDQTAGLFFKRGTNVWSISTLTGMVAGSPSSGQFGITAPTNQTLRVTNNYGSDRSVSLLIVGAQ